jgi:membrane protein
VVSRPVRDVAGGFALVQLVTIGVYFPFFWWTMHFLLAGRVSWRRMLPSAIVTSAFLAGLGV